MEIHDQINYLFMYVRTNVGMRIRFVEFFFNYRILENYLRCMVECIFCYGTSTDQRQFHEFASTVRSNLFTLYIFISVPVPSNEEFLEQNVIFFDKHECDWSTAVSYIVFILFFFFKSVS